MIYFVKDAGTGYVKIGFTSNIEERMATLQTGNPLPLVLLGAIKGGKAKERRIHKMLAADRVSGEWFRPSRRLANLLKQTWYGITKAEGIILASHILNPEAKERWERWEKEEPWRCRMVLAWNRAYE